LEGLPELLFEVPELLWIAEILTETRQRILVGKKRGLGEDKGQVVKVASGGPLVKGGGFLDKKPVEAVNLNAIPGDNLVGSWRLAKGSFNFQAPFNTRLQIGVVQPEPLDSVSILERFQFVDAITLKQISRITA